MEQFYKLLIKQLDAFYSLDPKEKESLHLYVDAINQRFLYNCSHLRNKYYADIKNLSCYHACQYLMFLYFCANTIFKHQGRCNLCDKIYNLSKMISSADIYYEIDLPPVFMLDHPVGTVLGRARYGNYFSFSQNCTVGNNKGIYPKFGDFVTLHANSVIVGNCEIGSNVIISANTYVKDQHIPSNSLVFNDYSQKNGLVIKEISPEKVKSLFESKFKK